MQFYTSAAQRRADILLRGYDENGKRVQRRIPYKPYLFVETQKQSEWRALDGRYVDKIVFDNTYEARDFIKRYEGVSGFEVFGMTNWVYPALNDMYPGALHPDFKFIRTGIIDIETWAEGEFPDIVMADKPITLITLRFRGKNLVFGYLDGSIINGHVLGEFEPEDENTHYFKCKDERDMLRRFIKVWQDLDFDAVTGWNNRLFDIPYTVNRIARELGTKAASQLSPWGVLEKQTVEIRGRETEIVTPLGIAICDYQDMYKKYCMTPRERYSLEYISTTELGVGKLDYSEYGSLHNFMLQNYPKYCQYNVIDCVRVDDLDNKLRYMHLLFTVAYTAKVNYNDAFTTVRPWDVIIHNYLLERKLVVPQFENVGYSESIEGGYVKDPVVGLHGWVVSYDVESLYPSLIRQANISPETFLTTVSNLTVEGMLEGCLWETPLRAKLLEEQAGICATGCVFDTSVEGFYPALMRQFFTERKRYKGMAGEYKQKAQKAKEAGEAYEELDNLAKRYDAIQNAFKLLLNSAYGALANQYYRWFDPKLAESITKTGQLAIQWVQRDLNRKLAEVTGIERDYVIAIDTDSNYLTMQAVVDKLFPGLDAHETTRRLDQFCKEVLQPTIDESFQKFFEYLNHRELVIRMKRECIADKGIWTAKKRYILNVYDKEGVAYQEPELKMMGIEAVKSSTPSAARDTIKAALKLIMNTTEKEFQVYIQAQRDRFRKLPYEEIAFNRGVKNLHKYQSKATIYQKGCPIHVRAALLYNHMIKDKQSAELIPIASGDKIKFAYMTMPNPILENVIASPGDLHKSLGLDAYIDRDLQFEKGCLAPIKVITDAIGWHLEPVPSLEDLFI